MEIGEKIYNAKCKINKIPTEGIIIYRPGTYKLGKNIKWNASIDGSAAIVIASSDVTLKFNGFSLKLEMRFYGKLN